MLFHKLLKLVLRQNTLGLRLFLRNKFNNLLLYFLRCHRSKTFHAWNAVPVLRQSSIYLLGLLRGQHHSIAKLERLRNAHQTPRSCSKLVCCYVRSRVESSKLYSRAIGKLFAICERTVGFKQVRAIFLK